VMNRIGKLGLLITLFTVAQCGVACVPEGTAPRDVGPKNVILMVGDGMGFEQVRAAGMYANGREGAFAFEKLPHRAEMTTHPAGGRGVITDSAAAGTALATGRKVTNGVLSRAMPGDGAPLRTVLEVFRDRGYRTGLVTTTFVTHATPAAFGGHVANRGESEKIARQYFAESRPNVLFGGVMADGKGVTREAAEAAGYVVVTDRREMNALEPERATHASGQFGVGDMPYEHEYAAGPHKAYDSLPHLSEMTAKALGLLENRRGFFLMVEGGRIDHACHANQIENCVFETIEFARTAAMVLKWARGRRDTLVLITADHECGGLRILENRGKGKMPLVEWATGGHTGVAVPIYAWGPGAERIKGRMDNTDPYEIMTGARPLPMSEPAREVPAQTGVAD